MGDDDVPVLVVDRTHPTIVEEVDRSDTCVSGGCHLFSQGYPAYVVVMAYNTMFRVRCRLERIMGR